MHQSPLHLLAPTTKATRLISRRARAMLVSSEPQPLPVSERLQLNECWLDEWMNDLSQFSYPRLYSTPTDLCGPLSHSFIIFSLHISSLPNLFPSLESSSHWWEGWLSCFNSMRLPEPRQAAVAGTHLWLWNLNEVIIGKLKVVVSLVHAQISFCLHHNSRLVHYSAGVMEELLCFPEPCDGG